MTEIDEEQVIREAEGGDGWKTAYWLVYVQKPIADELITNWDINQFGTQITPEKTYASIVPEDIKALIESKNEKFWCEKHNEYFAKCECTPV